MNFTSSMKRFLLSLLVLMGGLGMNRASASHYAAVDLSLKFVGNDSTDLRYQIIFDAYKVCEYTNGFGNADLSNFETICYSSVSGSFQGSWPLTQPIKDTLDQLCPGLVIQNSCRNVNGLPGFVRHRFIDTVTLPSRRTDWRFTWNQCCRNADITNLSNAGGASIFVEAGLNNLSRFNNSTPQYKEPPLPYVCVNQPTTYVNNPQDQNSSPDSLRTFSIQPRTLGSGNCPSGQNIAYSGIFSLANPVNSTVGNPYATSISTGSATFTPTQTGKFVIAFQTIEYDRFTGTQMGYISRDAQLIVLGCNAAPPTIDTVPINPMGALLLGQNELRICAGDSASFTVNAGSNTFVNQVYLSANTQDVSPNNPSNFTVVNNGTAAAVGTWSWQTTTADVGDYVLVITAKDSTCNNNQPIVLRSYLIVSIKVLPNIVASRDTFYCPPNGLPAQIGVSGPASLNLPWTWTAISPPGSPTSSLSCPTCDSTFATPSVTTDYIIETTPLPNLCRFKDTVRVTVIPNRVFTAGADQSICLNDLAQLQATVSAAPGLEYEWDSPSDSLLSDTLILNPTATPPSTTSFVLVGSSTDGCRYRDTVDVIVTGVRPLVSAFAGRDTVCPNGSTQLFSTVTQQPCGLATGICVGGTPEDKDLGTTTNTATLQSPFFTATSTGGHFVQMLYRREELEAAGMRPGYINSIGFNVVSKTSTAAFPKYTVFMGCTQETDLTAPAGSSTLVPIPGVVQVYSGNYTTVTGWNTINFPVPYYWDGVSNIAVQVCAAKRFSLNQGTTDVVYASTPADGFTSTRYLSQTYNPGNNLDTLSFCSSTLPVAQSVSALRPNTRFNVCSGNDYNYAWVASPGVTLDNATAPNTVASNLTTATQFTLTVTAASNANCFTTDVVNVEIDRSNTVDATPADVPFILCRPDYVQFGANGNGPRPIFNPSCGVGAPIARPLD